MEKLLPPNKEKYTGVRFEPECLGVFSPNIKQKALIKQLITAGKEFGKLDIKIASLGL